MVDKHDKADESSEQIRVNRELIGMEKVKAVKEVLEKWDIKLEEWNEIHKAYVENCDYEEKSVLSGLPAGTGSEEIKGKNLHGFIKDQSGVNLSEEPMKRYLKFIRKMLKQFFEISETVKADKGLSEKIVRKFEEHSNYLKKIKDKLKIEIEVPAGKKCSDSNPLEASTILTDSKSDYIKYLEAQNFMLTAKIAKICKESSISEELLKAIHKEIEEEFKLSNVWGVEKNSFIEFEKEILKGFTSILDKLDHFSSKLNELSKMYHFLFNSSPKGLASRIRKLEEKCIKDDFTEETKEFYSLIIFLQDLLTTARKEVISPTVEICMKPSQSESLEMEIMQKNYEDIVIMNMQLKGDILNNEGELTKLRDLEDSVKVMQEKCELLEKVNKELNSKKNDSDDSLDLDCSNIKDMIEIQELRGALRSISEKYEQEKETILRDCEEARQDIETQLFRLRNEKTYIEVKLKDSEKAVIEINREKERLEGTMINLRKEIERIKNMENGPRVSNSRRGSSELQLSQSGDFELTESLEKFAAVNANDLYEMLQEEVNELALAIKQNQLVPTESRSNKQLIEKLIENSVKIKNILANEVSPNTIIRDFPETLTETISRFKIKISMLEQEKLENQKKLEEINKHEHFEIQTEPSPRNFCQNSSLESSYFFKRQLEMEKSKLFEKKHEIHLHKEQIALLKQNVRDLQVELERASKLDVCHLREFWWNFGKELPILQKSAEDMIEVLMRMLGFSPKEIATLLNERKTKKGKLKFGLFS